MFVCRCTAEVLKREDDVVLTGTTEHHYRYCMERPAEHAPTPDLVNHPPHYTSHPSGVECIQITEHMSFTIGNALKYIWRADLKNGIEDLEKAKWYIEREIAKRKAAS
jgi:hypothetical protein